MPLNAVAAGALQGVAWAHTPIAAPSCVRRGWDALPCADARQVVTSTLRFGARTPARLALSTAALRHALHDVTPHALRRGVGVMQTPLVTVGMAAFDATFRCPPDASFDPVSPPCDPAWDRAATAGGLRTLAQWTMAACEIYVMTLAVCVIAGATIGAVRGNRVGNNRGALQR